MKKGFFAISATLLSCGLILLGCTPAIDSSIESSQVTSSLEESSALTTYQVNFNVNGGTPIESVIANENASIVVPTTTRSYYVFEGWYLEESFTTAWAVNSPITSNLSLYAKWSVDPTAVPTTIKLTDEDFSYNLTWTQGAIEDDTEFVVTFALLNNLEEYGDAVTVEGTHVVGDDDITVVWTPSVVPAPGTYRVNVATSNGVSAVTQDGIVLKGAGIETNPYLISSAEDFAKLNMGQKTVGANKYYALTSNLEITTAYANIQTSSFAGFLDGNDYSITVTGDTGLFYSLEATSNVFDLSLVANINSESTPSIGTLANFNSGLVSNVSVSSYSSGLVEDTATYGVISTAGTINDLSARLAGGAAGLVGTNQATGIIENSANAATVQAKIGGAGIVSSNFGTVRTSNNTSLIGATATTVSSTNGAVTPTYSYMGGISGFNFGTIIQCANNNNVFAQRNAKTASTNGNEAIGGIVGYNGAEGIISESYNAGRIHGDARVGGIAGHSLGVISYSYNIGAYGSRFYLGGIVGKMDSGSVSYCFSTTTYSSTSSTNSYKYTDAQLAGSYYAISANASNCVYNIDVRDGLAPVGDNNTTGALITSDLTAVLGEKFVYDVNNTTCATTLAWQVSIV